jgi:arginase
MSKIQLLGIPFDYGQPLTGVRRAYGELLNRGLLKLLEDFALVESSEIKLWKRGEDTNHRNIRYAGEASLASRLISHKIESLSLKDDFLLTIGGDHGIALGTVHGLLAHHPDPVIIWADAHGDINTPETSPSGNFHGMPLAFLLNQARHEDFEWVNRFIRPEKLILLGPRDLDEGEKDLINKLRIQYYSSEEINSLGMDKILKIALQRADPHELSPIHLSFDVDMCDAFDFHATGTRVAQGPKLEEIFLMGGLLAQTGRLRSMDVVEFNPELGPEEGSTTSTVLILEFIRSVLVHVFRQSPGNIVSSSSIWRGSSPEKNIEL